MNSLKPTILFLDDDAYSFMDKKEWLAEAGFDVIACTRIDQANEHLQERLDDIECIVADLNMLANWLPKEIQLETNGASMAGWVWLYRQVYPRKLIPTIVYSEFAKQLKKRLETLGASTEEAKIAAQMSGKIIFFSKRDTVRDGFGAVIDAIRELIKEG